MLVRNVIHGFLLHHSEQGFSLTIAAELLVSFVVGVDDLEFFQVDLVIFLKEIVTLFHEGLALHSQNASFQVVYLVLQFHITFTRLFPNLLDRLLDAFVEFFLFLGLLVLLLGLI